MRRGRHRHSFIRWLCGAAMVLVAELLGAALLSTLFWVLEAALAVHPDPSLRAWTQFLVLLALSLGVFSLRDNWCHS